MSKEVPIFNFLRRKQPTLLPLKPSLYHINKSKLLLSILPFYHQSLSISRPPVVQAHGYFITLLPTTKSTLDEDHSLVWFEDDLLLLPPLSQTTDRDDCLPERLLGHASLNSTSWCSQLPSIISACRLHRRQVSATLMRIMLPHIANYSSTPNFPQEEWGDPNPLTTAASIAL